MSEQENRSTDANSPPDTGEVNQSSKVEEPKVKVDSPAIEIDETSEKLRQDEIEQSRLSLPNEDVAELNRLAENYPRLDAAAGTIGRVWLEAFEMAQRHLMRGNVFSEAVERDSSEWRQKVESEGAQLGAGRPRFGGSGGQVLSGERALMKASSVLGLGSVVQIPLWHTGIWLSLKAPSEASLLELDRRIANEKISLGRYTSGMIFSNTSVYIVSYVVNFVLNHVYDASVKDISQESLKRLIKVTDIPTLIWGLVCTIYPNGYKYTRPCTTDPSKCQHIVTGKLSLSKLSWTDRASLSAEQRRHMSRRNDKFTQEELEKYQNAHTRGGKYQITVNDNLSFRLKVPSIAQYEQAGFSWVDNIVKMLEGSLGVSLKGQERDDYISDQGRLTALRQYAHWVDMIEVGEDTIEDGESVESVLGMLSSDDEIAKPFFEKVGKYIDNSTLSLIAIPKYKCPSCGGEQEGDVPQNLNEHLLPLDMCKIFFTLSDQRIFRSLTRARL